MDKPGIEDFHAAYRERDTNYWKEIEALTGESGLELSDIIINYPAFIRRREMTRLLADYELFKLIADLPGSIAEFGVYLGAGIFTWSKMLETFAPGDRSRKVYGFESEGGYQNLSPEDGNPQPWIDNVVGPKIVPQNYLDRMCDLTNLDNMLPGIERVKVVRGDIEDTAARFTENSQGVRFSLLYFDVNLYQPTLTALRHFYPLLMPGGVVAFNGYGSPPWQGESRAFEDYFVEIGQPQPELRKFSWSIHPSGYFVKR